ncbi:hypothetical protein I316_05335 [Kwoniella heveanensis BCC8398]|uniref:PWWP domain-containing protein n=1 Tax=Kwoniella heveanensis BCC8398 TaxID=1296120 RepID=A0A1B9GPQ4_9TREE|nr:hypothetical protein I316_05335 [Kwoniella heveanensis BCC8398]
MPKRKTAPCDLLQKQTIPLNSLDAALDLLVCDTFTRLEQLTKKFEACANVKLEDGVVKKRFEEAVKRYWVMKSMDELCCGAKKETVKEEASEQMEEDVYGHANGEVRRGGGRPLPNRPHPGAVHTHSLDTDEEQQWRRWTPKVGDVVLVETAEAGFWPGKIIDKKNFFQGRTVPRGNHFFPVRIYNEDMQPTVTVKSRLVPLYLRPDPPLLASPALLSAYHHAASPATFDMLAAARESLAAHNRTHPGVGDEPDRALIKVDKENWNKVVNWVMNERRIEKLRAVNEEREKQLRMVSKSSEVLEGEGEGGLGCCEGSAGEAQESSSIFVCQQKKRRTRVSQEMGAGGSASSSSDVQSTTSIFGPLTPNALSPSTPQRVASPSLASFIRPALSTPQRPSSPRRSTRDKRRTGIYVGLGEHSPRGRGGTYTPPRILPSGDETAPRSTGSPVPTLHSFDFVSPLGPVKRGKLANGGTLQARTPVMLGNIGRSGSLEAVREEEDEEPGWTLVQKKGRRRAGSEPPGEKQQMKLTGGDVSQKEREEEMMEM